jgi:4-amino-4-deoxy-L-arabinose transferase-like glycosyltransferase
VLLELVPSKLPHYVLPCYVPLAILVGRMWEVGLERPTTPAQKRVLGLWAVVGILLGMLLLTLSARSGSSGPSLALAAGGLALVGTFATVGVLTARGRLAGAFGAVTAGTVLVYALGGLWLLPALEPYRFSRNIARTANALTTPGEPVLVCGYAEPSMFFYLEGPARVVAPHEIAAADGTVIIREAELSGLTLEPDEAWQRITGFNYVKGRDEVVWVGRVLK